MTTIALVNITAAGVGGNGLGRMRSALDALGVDAEVLPLDLSDPGAQMRILASRLPDRLVVWGGDGTHRTALNVIGRAPSPLVLLPGGTKNFLSRSLHGASPWEIILGSVLNAAEERIVPAGEINGERFYCALLAGAPARLAQARESFRHGDMGKAFSEVGAALDEINGLHLAVRYRDHDGPEQSLPNTNLVAGLVGPLSANGRMEIAILPHPSVITTLDVVWSSFNSGFRDLPGVVTASAEILTVENEVETEIPVVVDGEAIGGGKRICARFVEVGGYCLTPPGSRTLAD